MTQSAKVLLSRRNAHKVMHGLATYASLCVPGLSSMHSPYMTHLMLNLGSMCVDIPVVLLARALEQLVANQWQSLGLQLKLVWPQMALVRVPTAQRILELMGLVQLTQRVRPEYQCT